mmetsp:Transcript_23304/g.38980  ORF Transcript_23304/g.38980 Transcript_23304/m.38980 type:complete len:215 (-) Transcript_23304:128-772(-)|eukprot:CAMPEP_0198229826 /NCGR_PEP_ID=MMETSP1445-20131203/114329_1 /TAXON_ID=36898 /ORGANISM="Pyramimonas sp., Strain CCMP2087" /LENGTH=214 /DNA_ID=CAMNT_0043910307 /DNA_START=200 /DNA_END=844 /DNA_ORIENTATION=+
MSLNPRLYSEPVGDLGKPCPVGFVGEVFILSRDGMELEFELSSTGTTVNCRGVLFLSNVRMVFIADKPTADFTALDMPLAYLRSEKINQPIFWCNNLTANVFSVESGGPTGDAPPWPVKFYFKEGGLGTFIPLFFDTLQVVRTPPLPASDQTIPSAPPGVEEVVRRAYVDPNDPTTVYLTQPTEDRERIQPGGGYPSLTSRAGAAMRAAATAMV